MTAVRLSFSQPLDNLLQQRFEQIQPFLAKTCLCGFAELDMKSQTLRAAFNTHICIMRSNPVSIAYNTLHALSHTLSIQNQFQIVQIPFDTCPISTLAHLQYLSLIFRFQMHGHHKGKCWKGKCRERKRQTSAKVKFGFHKVIYEFKIKSM